MSLARIAPRATDPAWELAAESINVKIRWFGLVIGILIVAFGNDPRFGPSLWERDIPLYAILLLGLVFTGLDTAFYRTGRLFLKDFPLAISALEALFITLLCHFDNGPESPFRFYYLLSLVCCAIRYSPQTTVITCAMGVLGYSIMVSLERSTSRLWELWAVMIVVLVWLTWAAMAMARLLKTGGEELRSLNAALRENQAQLESRISERTQELQESQAQLQHQEKMAGFGLLAAGIAHEVGNPLASISGIVQMLDARDSDQYTKEKLTLVSGQLARIQGILRELVTFSRPASNEPGKVHISAVIDEALNIAKYYKGGKSRSITSHLPPDLPPIDGVRDQLIQVVFNLVLNAIDATGKGGKITVRVEQSDAALSIAVADNGCGIDEAQRRKLFTPYFTTKKHGTGLGLFVTRRIVEEHGGRIACDSTPGVGTTFTITLPVRSSPGIGSFHGESHISRIDPHSGRGR